MTVTTALDFNLPSHWLESKIPRELMLAPTRSPLLPWAQNEQIDACASADDGDMVAGPWMLISGVARSRSQPHTWRGLWTGGVESSLKMSNVLREWILQ